MIDTLRSGYPDNKPDFSFIALEAVGSRYKSNGQGVRTRREELRVVYCKGKKGKIRSYCTIRRNIPF